MKVRGHGDGIGVERERPVPLQGFEQFSLDVDKYRSVLSSPAFDGLIGCHSWKILGTKTPSDYKMIFNLRVLPKPIPGCVKTSGIAGQGGITWPTHYSWHLSRESNGCWMCEQMAPEQPPIDVASRDGTPQVAQAKD